MIGNLRNYWIGLEVDGLRGVLRAGSERAQAGRYRLDCASGGHKGAGRGLFYEQLKAYFEGADRGGVGFIGLKARKALAVVNVQGVVFYPSRDMRGDLVRGFVDKHARFDAVRGTCGRGRPAPLGARALPGSSTAGIAP